MKRLRFDVDRILEQDSGLPILLSVRAELDDSADTLSKLRALQAFDRGAMRYAIQRTVRCASRRSLEELFDDLALNAGFAAHRLARAYPWRRRAAGRDALDDARGAIPDGGRYGGRQPRRRPLGNMRFVARLACYTCAGGQGVSAEIESQSR